MIALQTRFRLLILVVVAIASSVVVSLFQKNHSYFFEVSLSSNRAETAKVFFDLGQGIRESIPYQHSAGSLIYRFAIPTGLYSRMCFAPLNDEGCATFYDAKIVDRKGRLIRTFVAEQFKPYDQIAHATVKDGAITVQTVPHATGPWLEILIGEPFQLGKIDFDFLHNAARAFPVFLIFFLGGLAAGVVPAFTVRWQGLFRCFESKAPALVAASPTTQRNRWITMLDWIIRRQRILIVLAAGGISLGRMPDRFFNPQFWAEDGYFFTWALRDGLQSLWAPYGGYHLLVPRLAEIVATHLPLIYAPAFLNLIACVIALVVVSRVLSQRSQLTHAPLLAFCIVLVPRPEDIFLSIENIQWIMALAFILLLISSDAHSHKQRLYDYTASILCGLTGVFSILFLPFFGLRALQRRSTHSTVLAVLVAVTAMTQAWFVAHNPPLYVEHASRFNYSLVPVVTGFQLFVRLFGGEWLPQMSKTPLFVAGILVVAYWCLIYLDRGDTIDKRGPRRMLILAMIAALAASIYRFKYVLFIFATPEHIARYFLIPQVLFVWLLVSEFSRSLPRRIVAFTLFFAFLINTLTFFRVEPLWDYEWAKCVQQIYAGENVAVPMNPPGWYFQYIGKPN